MLITTYGRTTENLVTDEKIAETQKLISTLRTRRGEQPCSWTEATEIATRVAGQMSLERIAARAGRMDRIWRAKRRMA